MLDKSSLFADGIVANGSPDGFFSQVLPWQIRVHDCGSDFQCATRGAIVDKFDRPYGMASKNVRSLGFEWPASSGACSQVGDNLNVGN